MRVLQDDLMCTWWHAGMLYVTTCDCLGGDESGRLPFRCCTNSERHDLVCLCRARCVKLAVAVWLSDRVELLWCFTVLLIQGY